MNETTSLIEMDLGTTHEMAYQQRKEFKMPFSAKLRNVRSNLYLMPKARKSLHAFVLQDNFFKQLNWHWLTEQITLKMLTAMLFQK